MKHQATGQSDKRSTGRDQIQSPNSHAVRYILARGAGELQQQQCAVAAAHSSKDTMDSGGRRERDGRKQL